jgi:CRISPR/Cas system-associated protein Cas7 (RAMP superfamily)
MQALDERKTNGRWKVAYMDPQQVSEPQHTFVMSDHLSKEIDEQTKTQEEKDAIIKKYHIAKHHEAAVYIAIVMKKQQDKDSIMCAYNFQ